MSDAIAQLLSVAVFAADKHRGQRRKNANASPYINHPLEVASVLANAGGVTHVALLSAALLHDTVEDTNTTFEELEEQFGELVSRLVSEVTDDKSLPKPERKQRQVEHAPHKSELAKQLKIADKICNVRDIGTDPPADWDDARRDQYLSWAEAVVDGCRGVNPKLDQCFDETIRRTRAQLRGA